MTVKQIFSIVTCGGMREMTLERFEQAVQELASSKVEGLEELINWLDEREREMIEDGNHREVYCLQRVSSKVYELIESNTHAIE